MAIPDIIAAAATFVAALTDLMTGKVYNALTYPLVAAGLAASIVIPEMSFLQSLGGLVLSVLVFYICHRLAGLGAGDVKLMAAVGAWKGFAFVVFATFYILLFGAVLGVILLAWRRHFFQSIQWSWFALASLVHPVKRDLAPAPRTAMPYAPAIFFGVTYCIYLETIRGPFSLSWLA